MRQLDLDTPENIDTFVALFYEKIFVDEKLSPIFLNHAGSSIATHLPVVSYRRVYAAFIFFITFFAILNARSQ